MSLTSPMSTFLSSADPSPASGVQATTTVERAMIQPTLGTGEDLAKAVLRSLQGGPLSELEISSKLEKQPEDISAAVKYLSNSEMLERGNDEKISLSPFAQNAVKIFSLA